MTRILAVDPGTTASGYCLYDTARRLPVRYDKVPNAEMLRLVAEGEYTRLVIEEVRSYGMAVGRDVFETVKWTGRFWQAAYPHPVAWLGRLDVKLALCGSARAKDANVRVALLDRYGGSDKAAKGTKAAPGPLYGMAGDMWSALGLAEAWADMQRQTPVIGDHPANVQHRDSLRGDER